MSTRKPASASTPPESPVLSPAVQEIRITAQGDLVIPWIHPPAGDLVAAVWAVLADDPFPADAGDGTIYCG